MGVCVNFIKVCSLRILDVVLYKERIYTEDFRSM